MNVFDEIAALRRRGLDILRAAHQHAPRELVDRARLSHAEARTLVRTAEAYLGPTRHTRKQRTVLAAAERNTHSLQTLTMINDHARRLRDATQAWALRVELTAMSAPYDAIRAHAAARVRELNATEPAAGERQPRLTRRIDHQARTMSFSLLVGMRTGAALQASLEAMAATLREEASTRPFSAEELGDAHLGLLRGEGGLVEPVYTPLIAVGLPTGVEVVGETGDDVLLGASDGSTFTGEEFVNATLSEHGYVGLYHPVTGGVNLYEDRFANAKQRTLAEAENLICPWPGCGRPAVQCQVHHITAHKKGGQTAMVNLTMACRYHNGVNDDDPDDARRGRLVRVDGHVSWQPPGGGPAQANDHPLNRLGALHLI